MSQRENVKRKTGLESNGSLKMVSNSQGRARSKSGASSECHKKVEGPKHSSHLSYFPKYIPGSWIRDWAAGFKLVFWYEMLTLQSQPLYRPLKSFVFPVDSILMFAPVSRNSLSRNQSLWVKHSYYLYKSPRLNDILRTQYCQLKKAISIINQSGTWMWSEHIPLSINCKILKTLIPYILRSPGVGPWLLDSLFLAWAPHPDGRVLCLWDQ